MKVADEIKTVSVFSLSLSVCLFVSLCVCVACLCTSRCVCLCRFVVMNFMSSRAAKQAADDMKTVREDLIVKTDDGAAFARESA